MKLLRETFQLLGNASIKRELVSLNTALREPGLKLGIRKSYAQGFDNLRGVIRQVQTLEGEIHAMLTAAFRQLNTDYGFALQATEPPTMERFTADLDAVERSHLRYLGLGHMVQLARAEFSEKLVRALLARVRSIFETALGEIELWNKATTSQLDTQLRERRRAYSRRIEAIERIQDAAGGLDQRLRDLEQEQAALQTTAQRLRELGHDMRRASVASTTPPELTEVVPA